MADRNEEKGRTHDQPETGGRPEPTHADQAEQTRMGQASRPDGTPDREEKLVKVGRGHQTHG